ncbi:MAG: hypothetical protein HY075_08905, partial [Deltaproteobacteria bacterium]|nr:hypothetical protein [Deltaproteobacteria bacterium]
MTEKTPRRPPWLAPLLAGAIARLSLPWYGHGFRYMDEHWQTIEPANGLIHGAWSVTTEWRLGLRSWIYPGAVSLLIRAAEALGLRDPIWIVSFVRTLHGALACAAIPLTYLAVDRLTGGPSLPRGRTAALLSAWMVALWPFSIYCGYHTQGDMTGALFVLAGVAAPALFENEGTGLLAAGLAFGAALAIKIDLAVAGLGYGIWLLVETREPRRALARAAWLVAGVAPRGFVGGLVDRLTWHQWFHSIIGHA